LGGARRYSTLDLSTLDISTLDISTLDISTLDLSILDLFPSLVSIGEAGRMESADELLRWNSKIETVEEG